MENDENKTQFKKGRLTVDKAQLTKHRNLVVNQWNEVKHKSRLKLLIGSNAVSDYFNCGLVTEKNNNIINEYFKDYLK